MIKGFVNLLAICLLLRNVFLDHSEKFFKHGVHFLVISCLSPCALDINSLLVRCLTGMFFHSVNCISIVLICFFCCTEASKFDVIPLNFFCFCWLCFLYNSLKNSSPRWSMDFQYVFFFQQGKKKVPFSRRFVASLNQARSPAESLIVFLITYVFPLGDFIISYLTFTFSIYLLSCLSISLLWYPFKVMWVDTPYLFVL